MRVKIEVVDGPARGQVLRLRRPDCVLFGRAADSRLVFANDNSVSRHHFLLQYAPPRCMMLDLASKHGVTLNGVQLWGRTTEPSDDREPGVYLKNGDTIGLGNSLLRVSISKPKTVGEDIGEISGEIVLFQEDEPSDEVRAFMEATGSRGFEMFSTTTDEFALEPQEESSGGVPEDEVTDFPGFVVQGVIGQNGLGKTYLATERASGDRVVIKTMHPPRSPDPVAVQRFSTWLDFIARADHPNLAFLREHQVRGQTFVLIYDEVPGITLDQLLKARGGRLPLDAAVPIFMQLLETMEQVHGLRHPNFRGLVHDHLHPKHVVLVEDGVGFVPVVTELGLAKAFEGIGLGDMTDPAGLVGAPEYWPREYVTHYRHINPATDVFSLAAIFYRVLTGHSMRPGFSAMRDMCAAEGRKPTMADYFVVIAKNPPVPIRTRLPRLPRQVAKVFDRALLEPIVPKSRRREALGRTRYRDAGRFKKALLSALRECGVVSL